MILHGDCLDQLHALEPNSVDCCVTSPPYWGLRDYGEDGQIGLEKTPEEYVSKMVAVFREVRRVLKSEGTLWLNLGDSYASGGMSNPSEKSTLGGGKDRGASEYSISRKTPEGLKQKDLVGIPWRVAFALQADGWWLRSDIIWHKPNPMPESVTDRPTKAHEYIFLMAKSERYYYEADAISERSQNPGDDRKSRTHDRQKRIPTNRMAGMREGSASYPTRNKRSVWTVTTKPYAEAHFATFPEDLIKPCILAGCPVNGTVLDPFFGAGTTGLVASKYDRKYIGIELNAEYIEMAKRRLEEEQSQMKLPGVVR